MTIDLVGGAKRAQGKHSFFFSEACRASSDLKTELFA